MDVLGERVGNRIVALIQSISENTFTPYICAHSEKGWGDSLLAPPVSTLMPANYLGLTIELPNAHYDG